MKLPDRIAALRQLGTVSTQRHAYNDILSVDTTEEQLLQVLDLMRAFGAVATNTRPQTGTPFAMVAFYKGSPLRAHLFNRIEELVK